MFSGEGNAFGLALRNNNIQVFYTKIIHTTSSLFYIQGDLYSEQWDTAGNFIGDKKIDLRTSKNGFYSLTNTDDGGYMLSGAIDEALNDVVSPAQIQLVKFDSQNNFQWQKIIKTIYPSWGIESAELNNEFYVSGMQQVTDSALVMIMMKVKKN